MISNGWIRIETDSGSGDTAIIATILSRNTGRSVTRTSTIVGTTDHGATAEAVFSQDPSELFIIVDHYEDSNGNTVTSLGASSAMYYIVGYANVGFIEATETGEKEYTDLNDMHQGEAWNYGFTVTEQSGNGDSHTVNLETAIQYGTDEQYKFRIPFVVYQNEGTSQRDIYFRIVDDGTAVATSVITQIGTNSFGTNT